MPRHFTLEHTEATGNWHWQCKENPNIEGWEPSKREGRREGRAACNPQRRTTSESVSENSDVILTPPLIDATVEEGKLKDFTIKDLEGEKRTFTTEEIVEPVFYWIAGIDCYDINESTSLERVIAILKVWNIYKGGENEEEVRAIHNLDEEGYEKLSNKTWYDLTITIEDDESLHWQFPN